MKCELLTTNIKYINILYQCARGSSGLALWDLGLWLALAALVLDWPLVDRSTSKSD